MKMTQENNNPPQAVDVLVIGGGVNGVGVALDAAGRGLTVALCEKGDLGGATSSSSSKLIHGGLRYLEHYEFRLVKEALAERSIIEKSPSYYVAVTFQIASSKTPKTRLDDSYWPVLVRLASKAKYAATIEEAFYHARWPPR